MKADDKEHIAPSMCYAYAALVEGAPFIMGAPNTTVDIPAMWELAEKTKMPIAGKDFKTGGPSLNRASLLSSVLVASVLTAGSRPTSSVTATVSYLTNPLNFRTKEVSKLSTLESILVPEAQPDLYGVNCGGEGNDHNGYYHKVRINYYPRATITKRAGTTSTSSAGWAIPCRSRSTSSAATLSLPHLCASTSCSRSDLAARRPLRHPALPELLPQEPDARLHQRRSTRKPPLPAVRNAEKRYPRNGWLQSRRTYRLKDTYTIKKSRPESSGMAFLLFSAKVSL